MLRTCYHAAMFKNPLKDLLRFLQVTLLSIQVSHVFADPDFLDLDVESKTLRELTQQRIDLMDSVAAWKWQHAKPIYDPMREKVLLAKILTRARVLGLQAEPILAWFETQISRAKQRQQQRFDEWNASAAAGPVSTGLGIAELRSELDRIGLAILARFYLLADSNQVREFVPDGVQRRPVPVLDRIAAAGLLRIGTSGDYPPFTRLEANRLAGFDIDQATKLARHLSVEPVFIHVSWGKLEAGLVAGRFDIAMGGVSRTVAREQIGDFSQSYHRGGKAAVARCVDAAKYTDLAAIDQAGIRVIVNPGGTNERFVKAGLRHASIVEHPDNLSIFDALAKGSADVMITDAIEIELQRRRHQELCRSSTELLSVSEKAYLLPQGSALVEQVDAWMGPHPIPSLKADLDAAIEIYARGH